MFSASGTSVVGTSVVGTSAAETLTVIVDGIDVAVVLNTNFLDTAAAVSGITIVGATIAVEGDYLKITSDSTGISSSIANDNHVIITLS